MYKNSEGYSDPTAGEAIGRITGEEKKHILTGAWRREKRTARLVAETHGSIRINRSAPTMS